MNNSIDFIKINNGPAKSSNLTRENSIGGKNFVNDYSSKAKDGKQISNLKKEDYFAELKLPAIKVSAIALSN